MAPVATFFPLLLTLSGALAAPRKPMNLSSKCARYYYGDDYGMEKPAPLVERRARTLPAGWSDAGCVRESHGERLLQGFAFSSRSVTAEFCINECAKRGYDVAGTEYGDECYCAHGFKGNGGTAAPATTCSKPCAGDRTQNCGAAWYLSLYTYNSTTAGSLACQGGSLIVTPPEKPQPSAPSTTAKPTPSATTRPSSSTAKSSTTSSPRPSTTSHTLPEVVPPSKTSGVGPIKTNVPQSNQPHFVWAHHMVGNTYSYTQGDWADDIARASNQAIDGFALNIGREDWQHSQAQSAYAAAQAKGNFKLFLSFDMTSMSCGSANDANVIKNLVQKHASSPVQAKYDNKVLVSTFSGSDCAFGTGSNTQGWEKAVLGPLKAAGIDVHFIPSIFVSPNDFSAHAYLDGELNWNSAWPMGNFDIGTGSTDALYIEGLNAMGAGKTYMSAVSPFFFTHFGADSWNKNWIYRSDDWLYCARWEEIIGMRGTSTMTEILTWNDYGESSYIDTIKGDLPGNSHSWVDGFDHSGLASITRYYATAFKTGKYPQVTKDEIVLWARPHAALASASNDPAGVPTNHQWTQDNLYAVVFATAPATVTLKSGSTSQTFNVQAGLSKLKMPSALGGIGGTVVRGGKTVASYDSGAAYSFTDKPKTYNFNYFVGASR